MAPDECAHGSNRLRDDWHSSIVRAALAVHEGGYLEYPERERQKIEAVIGAAAAFGMYVVVDWHAHYPAVDAADEYFSSIAQKYGHLPNVIYELWNEPLPVHNWSRDLKPYHERIIRAMRAHDPDNLIVVGTPSWSRDVDRAAEDPLEFSNIAYTFHFYASSHGQELRDKAQYALDRGVALMVTEWGTGTTSGQGPINEAETRRWLAFMDDNELSWCNWAISDGTENTAALMPGARTTGNWSLEMLAPSGRMVR